MNIREMKWSIIALMAILLLPGCQGNTPDRESNIIYVSITPLRMIVERITGDDFPIEIIVPAGASVESYELTPKQFIAINSAQMIFNTGLLNFEESIIKRIKAREKVVNLSQDIEVIAGSCSHNHSHSHNHHNHGVDPHIWTSPKELQIMAQNCYNAIATKYPDSLKYHDTYLNLQRELEELDRECAKRIEESGIESIFIYHPALSYYARAYEIEQIAIEDEGKEPSAKHLAQIIERGREEEINKILYQKEYPASSVEIVAEDIGAKAVEIDPLSVDIIDQIKLITHSITTK